MRTFFIILTCVAFAGWSLWARHHYTCKINDLCGLVTDGPTDEELANSLIVNIDGEPVLSGYEHFVYQPSTVEPDSMSADNQRFLDDLADWLKANPKAKVKISGNYLPDEKVKGIYETAGIARANKIRDLLVERGVDADMLNIDSDPLAAGGDLSKPLNFNGTSGAEELAAKEKEEVKEGETEVKEEDPNKEELVEAKFEFKNMTFSDVSFDKGKAIFKPVPNFVLYADSVSRYLADHPDQKLTIIGHTDSDGSDADNIRLGMERAKSVRNYFINSHGIKRDRIVTKSEGEKSPVAPNDNETNMRKNRRVNMQIG